MSTKLAFALEEFHPAMPGFQEDPYPFYDRLREAGPVAFIPKMNTYWVIGHAEVSRIFQDKAFSVKFPPQPGQPPSPMAPHMLVSDPPDHTRLRSLVSKAFTPRTVEQMRPRIETLVDELLSTAGKDGTLNITEEIAFPLPATVIAELLGIPKADQQYFRQLSTAIIRAGDAASTLEEREAGMKANQQLLQYFHGLTEERRRRRRPT